jgi:hypothetical protein
MAGSTARYVLKVDVLVAAGTGVWLAADCVRRGIPRGVSLLPGSPGLVIGVYRGKLNRYRDMGIMVALIVELPDSVRCTRQHVHQHHNWLHNIMIQLSRGRAFSAVPEDALTYDQPNAGGRTACNYRIRCIWENLVVSASCDPLFELRNLILPCIALSCQSHYQGCTGIFSLVSNLIVSTSF